MLARLDLVRGQLVERGIDAFVIASLPNVRYLTGFTGSAGVAIAAAKEALFLTDSRYTTQAEQQVAGFEIREVAKPREGLVQALASLGAQRIGFEAAHLSVAEYQRIEEGVRPKELVPTEGLVEGIRLAKDSEEVACIRLAVELARQGFAAVQELIRPGVSEGEIALELEYRLKRMGSEGNAFDTIVASGERGAMPHGSASGRKLKSGELVTIDFGACVGGYYSDTTRTVPVGESASKQREVYRVVLEANRAGVRAVRPGVQAREIDQASRAVVEASGYGKFFGHGTGHGVGLEVHEGPRIATGVDTEIREGMVFTIEPGVYIPGWGGVRIEDMVLVTGDGCEVLTESIPKADLPS